MAIVQFLLSCVRAVQDQNQIDWRHGTLTGRLMSSTWKHQASNVPQQSTDNQKSVALQNRALLAHRHKLIARIIRNLVAILVTCFLIAHKEASLSFLRGKMNLLHEMRI